MNDDQRDLDFTAKIEFHPDLEGTARQADAPVHVLPDAPEVTEQTTPPAVSPTFTTGQDTARTAPALPSGFVLLSGLFQTIPVNERSKILDHFDGGIESGTVVAVRRQVERFPVEFIARTGRKRVRKVADWMIMDTPRFQEWIRKQRAESRYACLMARGEIAITETEILEDVRAFERLAKMQRELMKKKKGGPKTAAARRERTGVSE